MKRTGDDCRGSIDRVLLRTWNVCRCGWDGDVGKEEADSTIIDGPIRDFHWSFDRVCLRSAGPTFLQVPIFGLCAIALRSLLLATGFIRALIGLFVVRRFSVRK